MAWGGGAVESGHCSNKAAGSRVGTLLGFCRRLPTQADRSPWVGRRHMTVHACFTTGYNSPYAITQATMPARREGWGGGGNALGEEHQVECRSLRAALAPLLRGQVPQRNVQLRLGVTLEHDCDCEGAPGPPRALLGRCPSQRAESHPRHRRTALRCDLRTTSCMIDFLTSHHHHPVRATESGHGDPCFKQHGSVASGLCRVKQAFPL